MEIIKKYNSHGKSTKLKRPWSGIIAIAYDMFKDNKDLNDYMSEKVCEDCKGHRLLPQSLAVKLPTKLSGIFWICQFKSAMDFLPMSRILHILIANKQ